MCMILKGDAIIIYKNLPSHNHMPIHFQSVLPFLAHTYCACWQYVFDNLIMPLLISPESDISHVKARLWTFSSIYLLICLLWIHFCRQSSWAKKLADMWTLIPTTRSLWPNSAIRRAWYAVPRQRGALSQRTTGLSGSSGSWPFFRAMNI